MPLREVSVRRGCDQERGTLRMVSHLDHVDQVHALQASGSYIMLKEHEQGSAGQRTLAM
jgi:hypothetical protein